MKQTSGKDLARAVEGRGWTLLRVTGSHHILPDDWGKQGPVVRLSMPIRANKPLKVGLLRHLLKQAGLGEEDL